MKNISEGFLSSSALKIFAAFSMVIDHSALVFVPRDIYPDIYEGMRLTGRLAFPIFCFFIVEGFYHTKNIKKYLGRLLLLAIFSEVPFDLMIASVPGTYTEHQNVLFTLFIGLLAVCCIDSVRDQPFNNMTIIIIACFTAYLLNVDYSYCGILQILFFYYMREMRLYRILGIILVNILMNQPFGAVSMVLIELYNGRKGFNIKYFIYFFYPMHLLVLYFIRRICAFNL